MGGHTQSSTLSIIGIIILFLGTFIHLVLIGIAAWGNSSTQSNQPRRY